MSRSAAHRMTIGSRPTLRRCGIRSVTSHRQQHMDPLLPQFDFATEAAAGAINAYLEQSSSFQRVSFGDPHFTDLSSLVVALLPISEALNAAGDAIAKDPELQELLRTKHGQQAFVGELSNGSRLDSNPRELALQLLAAAAKWEYLFTRPLTSTGLSRRVDENLAYLRAGLTGKPVTSIRVIGYTGLPLEPGTSIETPWGRLIPSPKPSVGAVIAATSGTPYGQAASALLLIDAEFALDISWEAQPPPLPRDTVPGHVFNLLPLAFLLATDDGSRVVPTVLWDMALPRVMGLGFGAGRHLVGPSWTSRSTTLDAKELASAIRWCSLLEQRHNSNIDIAVRRCLSSGALRQDPADKLVDAVIAWENLFGAAPETSFRLAAAIAKLLSVDPTQRRDLLKKVRGLYQRRSEVAHGANVQTVEQDAEDALDIAVQCLRMLYDGRADLLAMEKSEQRANQLLLVDP